MTVLLDDGELIQLMSHRDSQALMGLYDRYNRLAFALAYRIVGDPSLAEEVVQDAFLLAWNRADSFDRDRGGNVRGWLMTIVHNRSIDMRRKHLDGKPRHVPVEDVEQRLATPDAWGQVATSITGEEVRAALKQLPDEQRRAIELAYFDDMTHFEIAEHEGAPLGTVKGRLRLGLKRLYTVMSTSGEASL
ncbi:MAG: sigma-70 family RNA polymerase sigma factor [Thermomicrobiales bacterium]